MGESMTTYKAFLTSEMSEEMFEFLRNTDYFVENGWASWTVGDLVKDASPNPEKYFDNDDDFEMAKKIDAHFISGGAVEGETVLIEHG
jgi:hypothetical protein